MISEIPPVSSNFSSPFDGLAEASRAVGRPKTVIGDNARDGNQPEWYRYLFVRPSTSMYSNKLYGLLLLLLLCVHSFRRYFCSLVSFPSSRSGVRSRLVGVRLVGSRGSIGRSVVIRRASVVGWSWNCRCRVVGVVGTD